MCCKSSLIALKRSRQQNTRYYKKQLHTAAGTTLLLLHSSETPHSEHLAIVALFPVTKGNKDISNDHKESQPKATMCDHKEKIIIKNTSVYHRKTQSERNGQIQEKNPREIKTSFQCSRVNFVRMDPWDVEWFCEFTLWPPGGHNKHFYTELYNSRQLQ